VTLADPVDVIAPRGDDMPYDTADFLRQMMDNSYPEGTVLAYEDLRLEAGGYSDHAGNVYTVYTEDGTYIETVNLGAFRTVTELEQLLKEIVAYDPDGRDEWVSSR
jgi:hypothetical protein